MARAVLDVERFVAPDGHPRDARRPEVVPRQGLARVVGREELGPRDAREFQEAPKAFGEVARARHLADDAALAPAFVVQRAEHGKDRRLDAEATGEPRLLRSQIGISSALPWHW
jgi:hypothetical protein